MFRPPISFFMAHIDRYASLSQSISHKATVASLSLSPLVTDPAAPRPPGEREEVHRFSVRRRRGSTSRSAVLAVLFDQAPTRQGLRHLLADFAHRRSPSYIPTTPRYPLRPCSTARLPTSLHVENLACGSSIVLCPKRISSGVLSILQSRF